jgi:hypothetical protein
MFSSRFLDVRIRRGGDYLYSFFHSGHSAFP